MILEEPVCMTCARGIGMGRLCTCHAGAYQFHNQALMPRSCPASSTESSSEYSDLISCFSSLLPHNYDNEEAGEHRQWRCLLRNMPPGLSLNSSHWDAARRRHENGAWRHWWTAHQSEQVNPWQVSTFPLFAATPTSTFAGTPQVTCPNTPRRPSPGLLENSIPSMSDLQHSTEIVYWPVPLSILPQVQGYIQQLLSSEHSCHTDALPRPHM
jgi:hypothetical protein